MSCSTCDDVTDDVILPLEWGGSLFRWEPVPYLSKYVCRICLRSDGRVEKGGYRQTDRQTYGRDRQTDRQTDKGTLQLYIVDTLLPVGFLSISATWLVCRWTIETYMQSSVLENVLCTKQFKRQLFMNGHQWCHQSIKWGSCTEWKSHSVEGQDRGKPWRRLPHWKRIRWSEDYEPY